MSLASQLVLRFSAIACCGVSHPGPSQDGGWMAACCHPSTRRPVSGAGSSTGHRVPPPLAADPSMPSPWHAYASPPAGQSCSCILMFVGRGVVTRGRRLSSLPNRLNVASDAATGRRRPLAVSSLGWPLVRGQRSSAVASLVFSP